MQKITIDCIADLHGHYSKLEGGDLLIVAGDLTARDHVNEYSDFFAWLSSQKYIHKVLIAGNHDNEIEEGLDYDFSEEGIHYLEDSGVEIEGLKIWGSPWTKTFPGMNPKCMAFTADSDEDLAEKWALIPEDTDILITHSPPYGIFDEVSLHNGSNFPVGSKSLRQTMFTIKPKLMVFGHIHECGGRSIDLTSTTCVNASVVNEQYKHVNKPVRINLNMQ